MPFPLPRDPDFIKEVVESWVIDIRDRVEMGDVEGARVSLSIANKLYLSLPAGNGDDSLEKRIIEARVNLEQHS